jgi:hypothetical protein
MSMMCWLIALTPAQIDVVEATPSLASDLAQVTSRDAPDAERREFLNRLPPERRAEFEARLRQAMESMPDYKEHEASLAEARRKLAPLEPLSAPLSLAKSWHILHYVFTGHVDEADAPGNALLAGSPLGEDLGYGPPRLVTPAATREFAEFLSRQALDRLEARVNIAEMRRLGIYSMPGGPGSEAEFEAELRQEVSVNFPRLKAYVGHAAANGSGLLIWLA